MSTSPDYSELYFLFFCAKSKKEATVDDWIDYGPSKEEDLKKYPNAKKAAELIASPLYKALE